MWDDLQVTVMEIASHDQIVTIAICDQTNRIWMLSVIYVTPYLLIREEELWNYIIRLGNSLSIHE